jgi:hypothetical protein
MQKNLEMEAKAQEEAERERKREAIRQRIAAAKAASSDAVSVESKTDIKDSKESQGKPTVDDKVKDCEKSSETKEIIRTGTAPEVADAPDCYDVDPSFSSLPLPTKEAGEALITAQFFFKMPHPLSTSK